MKLRAKPIHTKKLFGGKSAMEVHARWGWRKPCSAAGCRGLPVIKVTSFMAVREFAERAPHMAHLVAARAVQMTFGPMVRVATQFACAAHRAELERAAARAPSCYFVEIDRGPTPDRLVSGPAGASTT